jgi:hypothetical protein
LKLILEDEEKQIIFDEEFITIIFPNFGEVLNKTIKNISKITGA